MLPAPLRDTTVKRASYKIAYPLQGFASRFRHSLRLGVIVITFMLILFGGGVIRDRIVSAEEQADRQAENYARILENSFAGTLQKIDLALASTVDEVEHENSEGSTRTDRILDFLKRQDRHIPETLGLRVSDAAGWIQYSASASEPGTAWKPVDIRDRPHFQHFKNAGPDAGLFISEPLHSKISDQLTIALARAYKLPDGSFGGIVYAAVPVSYFVDRLSQLDLGDRGNSGLWSRHALIARFSRNDPAGARSGANTPSAR